METKSERLSENQYKKGSVEYYRELCYSVDIELKFDMQRMFDEKYKQAIKNKDYGLLHSIFYQEIKVQMMPLSAGGYDHSARFPQLLTLLVMNFAIFTEFFQKDFRLRQMVIQCM